MTKGKLYKISPHNCTHSSPQEGEYIDNIDEAKKEFPQATGIMLCRDDDEVTVWFKKLLSYTTREGVERMKDTYYSIAIIALILMFSCVTLITIMPFEAHSEMRGIFAVVLSIQMVFDFVFALFYIFKAQELKE